MGLGNARLDTVLSCTDLSRATNYYTQTLGLKKLDLAGMPQGHVTLEAGNGCRLVIYQRPAPPKAENTVANFEVENVEQAVVELLAKGVKFEEYDFPGLKTVNGVATMGDYKAAWFKDPDGNIVALGSMV